MNKNCNLCLRDSLEATYWRAGSPNAIYVCSHCGLMQSGCAIGPDNDRAPFPPVGKIADDKRANGAMALIRSHCDITRPLAALDVGAGRGSFVRKFLNAAPCASITAIEPNAHRAWACAFLNRSNVIAKPIEEISLPDERFDIIHSLHTLEHLDEPLAALAELWRALKSDGLLILECRNIGVIGDVSIVDEWFKPDCRNFYSLNTLSRLMHAAGFEIVDASHACERENILFAARKCRAAKRNFLADTLEVHATRALVSMYKSTRQRNLLALNAIVAELNTLCERGLAICGSGRLFDSLVQHAGLDRESFRHYSEAQLEIESSRCVGVAGPDGPDRSETKPGVIVVMSDSHAGEIADIAAQCDPHTQIIHYSELVFRAYEGLAA